MARPATFQDSESDDFNSNSTGATVGKIPVSTNINKKSGNMIIPDDLFYRENADEPIYRLF